MAVHRRGGLAQTNKKFKGTKHASKGALKRAGKGKLEGKAVSDSRRRNVKGGQSKADRRNAAKVARRLKVSSEATASRLYLGHKGIPKTVTFVALSAESDLAGMRMKLAEESADPEGSAKLIEESQGGPVTLAFPQFKQRLTLVLAPREYISLADAVRAADIVVPVLPGAEACIDAIGEEMATVIKSTGCPNTLGMMHGLLNFPTKTAQYIKKMHHEYLSFEYGADIKSFVMDTKANVQASLRQLTQMHLKPLSYRETHPYLLAQAVDYDAETGSMLVGGYVRGVDFDVNSSVHLPMLGDRQVSWISTPADPFPLLKSRNAVSGAAPTVPSREAVNAAISARSDPATRQKLDGRAVPDAANLDEQAIMDAEIRETDDVLAAPGSWMRSNEEEKKEQDLEALRLGAGDEFSAAWMGEEDVARAKADGTFGDQAVMEAEEAEMERMEAEMEREEEEQDDEHTRIGGGNVNFDAESLEMAAVAAEKDRRRLLREDDLEEQISYPDEVETPEDVACSKAFENYRGLKSFRNSPWDATQNLPADYAYIYRFQAFGQTRDRVLRDAKSRVTIARVGTWVNICVENVPVEYAEQCADPLRPCVISGLLEHEEKYSVVHFAVSRKKTYDDPIRSGDPMLVVAGFRTFVCNPMYSQINIHSDKNRTLKFFRDTGFVIASAYLPIMFGKTPMTMYTHPDTNEVSDSVADWRALVATGSMYSIDPNRLLIERAVLTGRVFKIQKKLATCRFMFYTAEDIRYFKSIEIYTRQGRTGHIREPLGLHGYMKCVFDGIPVSNDTVCMNLYKRVFPSFGGMPACGYDPIPDHLLPSTTPRAIPLATNLDDALSMVLKAQE